MNCVNDTTPQCYGTDIISTIILLVLIVLSVSLIVSVSISLVRVIRDMENRDE